MQMCMFAFNQDILIKGGPTNYSVLVVAMMKYNKFLLATTMYMKFPLKNKQNNHQ